MVVVVAGLGFVAEGQGDFAREGFLVDGGDLPQVKVEDD